MNKEEYVFAIAFTVIGVIMLTVGFMISNDVIILSGNITTLVGVVMCFLATLWEIIKDGNDKR